jgi:hypothetical protein
VETGLCREGKPVGQNNKRYVEPSRSFLLRCWQEPDGDGEMTWRFSLTSINEGRQTKGFVNLESLFAYLRRLLSVANRFAMEDNQKKRTHPDDSI